MNHYANVASKPPMSQRTSIFTLDFLEKSRSFTQDGEGLIRGIFLFSVDNKPPRQGILDLFYEPEKGVWRRTFRYHIEEQDVDTIILHTRIKDSVADVPVEQVEVFARRLKDEFCMSRRVRTDALGVANLEVLAGDFQILVDHPDYQPVDLLTVSAAESELHMDEIGLVPVLRKPRMPVKFRNP